MNEFGREERVGAEIRRELAMLLRDEARDPRLTKVTVQEVRVVRDLSHAKVYFTVMEPAEAKATESCAEQGVGFSASSARRDDESAHRAAAGLRLRQVNRNRKPTQFPDRSGRCQRYESAGID